MDGNHAGGWIRTGQSFRVLPLNDAGSRNVCRFWSGQSFAPRSSPFYTPFAEQCTPGKVGSAWRFEGEVFAMTPPDATGSCPWGSAPLYRLCNGGIGGAPNHRYSTKLAIREKVVAQGWTAEGVRHSVVGTGGTPLYPLGPPLPNSEHRESRAHGVLRLALGADGCAWQFVPVGGGPVLDAVSASCHR